MLLDSLFYARRVSYIYFQAETWEKTQRNAFKRAWNLWNLIMMWSGVEEIFFQAIDQCAMIQKTIALPTINNMRSNYMINYLINSEIQSNKLVFSVSWNVRNFFVNFKRVFQFFDFLKGSLLPFSISRLKFFN